jgi:hypothetical protein
VKKAKSSVIREAVPYLLVLLMTLPLAIPYLEPGYQFADDRYSPYLRVEGLRQAVGEGQVPPRWFAEFDGGYGSPYPSFYAMLFYDLAALINVAGVSVGAAVELSAFLVIIAAAVAMFVLVRSLWGVESGFLAAALYVYAPYHLVDAFIRGALSELAAFFWFPVIVYAIHRTILTRKKAWLAAAGLSIAGLILTHNLMPIIFLPVVVGLMGIFAVLTAEDAREKFMGVGMLGVSAGLGLLISAYFWLPIVFERGLLRLDYFLQYDFHGDFVSRGTLFAWASAEPPYASIGLVLVGAALAGSLVGLWSGSRSPHKILSLGALGAGTIFLFMVTRKSAWIWERVPLLPLVQFPWRFLAPASFSLALASGPLPRLLRNSPARWSMAIAVAGMIYVQSSPLIHIADRIDGVKIDQMQICQEVWGTQDYRPSTSQTLFWRGPTPPGEPNDPLILLPCQGSVKLSSSGDAQVRSVSRQGLRWQVRYSAAGATTATIPQFYFPGWSAAVDGVPTAIEPAAGNGLLQVALPAGVHLLQVDYGETRVERIGDLLTVMGIAILVGIGWSAWRDRASEAVG